MKTLVKIVPDQVKSLGFVSFPPSGFIGAFTRWPVVVSCRTGQRNFQFDHGTSFPCKAAALCLARGVAVLVSKAATLFNFLHSRFKAAPGSGRALLSAGSENFMAQRTQVMSAWDRGPCSSLCTPPTQP